MIVTAQVSLLNTGKVDSKEIVQLYITDPVMNLVRYWKVRRQQLPYMCIPYSKPFLQRLIGFKKVAIKSGSTATVDIDIKGEDLAFYDENVFQSISGKVCLLNDKSVYLPVIDDISCCSWGVFACCWRLECVYSCFLEIYYLIIGGAATCTVCCLFCDLYRVPVEA